MACAKKGNLPHFFPLLGKILVLRVLPAYRKKIGCFPLNPPAPVAGGCCKRHNTMETGNDDDIGSPNPDLEAANVTGTEM